MSADEVAALREENARLKAAPPTVHVGASKERLDALAAQNDHLRAQLAALVIAARQAVEVTTTELAARDPFGKPFYTPSPEYYVLRDALRALDAAEQKEETP